MLSRISYALRTLRLLSIVEHAPKYGRQIAKIAPELFFSDSQVIVGEKPERVPAQYIYMTLQRLAKAKLIQQRVNYTPPKSLGLTARNPRGIVWYELTTQGRRTLREAREALKLYIGEPQC